MKAEGSEMHYLIGLALPLRAELEERGPEIVELGRQGTSIVRISGRPPIGSTAPGYDCERLLDRYHLYWPTGDEVSRARAEESLFELLADHYETEIDRSNNIHNISALLGLVRTAISSDIARPQVLDFGCGTGLSASLAGSFEVELVGCDRSRGMLEVARTQGLRVGSVTDLKSGALGAFDGMIAGYVLHLAVPREDIEAAVACMRPGAVIAANFHKDAGYSEVSRVLSGTRRCDRLEAPPGASKSHGRIGLWRVRPAVEKGPFEVGRQ